MFQFIFDCALSHKPLVRVVFYKIRRLVNRVIDPIVVYKLHGHRLHLNLSHELPFYRKKFPTYSENLSRLTTFIRERRGHLHMIDVGANIGDSYALASSISGDTFLLIEGNPIYFQLLEMNTYQDDRVTRSQVILSDIEGDFCGNFVVEKGTAGLIKTDSQHIYCHTLDGLLKSYSHLQECNLLKIDVDGYDIKVLKGAMKTIGQECPVLFFEYSPKEIIAMGGNPIEVYELLVGLGYSHLLFYDNIGILVGAFASHDTEILMQLTAYAQRREDYYYDICCFHQSQVADAVAFFEYEELT